MHAPVYRVARFHMVCLVVCSMFGMDWVWTWVWTGCVWYGLGLDLVCFVVCLVWIDWVWTWCVWYGLGIQIPV